MSLVPFTRELLDVAGDGTHAGLSSLRSREWYSKAAEWILGSRQYRAMCKIRSSFKYGSGELPCA